MNFEIVGHFPACLIKWSFSLVTNMSRVCEIMNEMTQKAEIINSGKEDTYLHLLKLSQFGTAA